MSGFRIVSTLPISLRQQGNSSSSNDNGSLSANGSNKAPTRKFNYDTDGLSDINQPEKDKESSKNKKK